MGDKDVDDLTSEPRDGTARPDGDMAGENAAAHGDARPGERPESPAETPGAAAGSEDEAPRSEEETSPGAGGAEETPPGAGGSPGTRRRGRRVLRWVAIGVAIVVVLAGGTAFALYEKLQGNINKDHVEDQLGTNRPAKLNSSMNILLLGSDSRDGPNHKYWSPDVAGERSDTTILLHLSPNRDRVVAVSFPRDSMVQVPECTKKNGQKVHSYFGMLNTAFTYAGAPCTWKTIEATTNIHIDHYVKIDFAGFKRVVDALGGVQICVPHAVNDPRAGLYLRAGKQVVKGEQALGYVRTRYGLGDGSDLERIQRQQKFMASIVKKATSGGMLADPARIYKFLDATTKAITADDKLSVSAMRKLATSLKGISAGTVRFVTVPTETYPKDPNRVQWNLAQAKPLFDAIRNDDALPAPPPAASPPPQVKPEDVKVTVVGAPKKVVAQLRAQRFKVTVGHGPKQPETTIRYGTGAERQADALGVAIPGVRIVPDPSVRPGTVALMVGPGGVQVQSPDIPKVKGEIKADQGPCAT